MNKVDIDHNTSSTTADLAERIARRKWVAVAIVSVTTFLLAVFAVQLKFEQSIESFFAPDSHLLHGYLTSKAAFGGDEFLVVGFPVDDPTSHETLDDIEQLSVRLSKIPGILPESMQDLASILRNDRAPAWMRVAMRLPAFKESIIEESRQMLVSEDDSTVAIAMRLEDRSTSPVSRAETFRQVREIAASHSPPAVVAGEPLQVFDTFRYVEDDALLLGLASSILLMLVILGLFRNLRWVILPLILIHVTLLWTKGILALSDMKLSMVSSMLTSLVTIIGVATVMHVTVTFIEMRTHLPRFQAYQQTFIQLAGPIFWTCVTTAVGFASLLFSSIVPVRSFAIMMTLSTLLIPCLCCLLLPAGILAGNVQADPRRPLGEARLVALLKSLCRTSNRHPRFILGFTCVIAVGAIAGLRDLKVETDFSKNFRRGSLILEAIEFFETSMGGVGTWEIGFDAPANLNEEFLNEVRTLAEDLRELRLSDGTKLTKVISLTDGLELVPRVPLDASGRLFPVVRRFRPATLDEKREFLSVLQPEMEPSLYRSDLRRMRIMLRSREQQPADVKLQLIDKVEELSRSYFPDAEATGLYVLLANLISSLLDDQLVSFSAAAFGVMVTMSLAFRSFKLGLISMIPNVLPILLLIGTMGWLNIPLNIGTAMIASVSMGLTVDSTIHYLANYLRQRKTGVAHLPAAESAHGSVGLALVLANLALVAGFSALTLSNFVPLADFGLLVSVAMIGGLVSNIFIMPVLLKLVMPQFQSALLNSGNIDDG